MSSSICKLLWIIEVLRRSFVIVFKGQIRDSEPAIFVYFCQNLVTIRKSWMNLGKKKFSFLGLENGKRVQDSHQRRNIGTLQIQSNCHGPRDAYLDFSPQILRQQALL